MVHEANQNSRQGLIRQGTQAGLQGAELAERVVRIPHDLNLSSVRNAALDLFGVVTENDHERADLAFEDNDQVIEEGFGAQGEQRLGLRKGERIGWIGKGLLYTLA